MSAEAIDEWRARYKYLRSNFPDGTDWRTPVNLLLDQIPDMLESLDAMSKAEPASLLRALVDPDPCDWDHNHSCQAHGFFYIPQGEKCPNQAAQDWLAVKQLRESAANE